MDWLNKLLTINFDNLIIDQIPIRLLGTIAVIVTLYLVRMLAIKFVDSHVHNPDVEYQWRKTSIYLITFIGVILIGRFWITGIQSILTVLGLISAGIAIALQKPITDMAGWLFILSRQPFKIGDRIEIGQHAGDVIDIRVFQFIILEIGNWVEADQSTGRIIHIPNGKVFVDPLANYGEGFSYIWNELQVHITFESNWQQAKTILQDIANEFAQDVGQTVAMQMRQSHRRYPIKYNNLTPTIYTRVEQNGVLLTMRYLCEVRRRRSSEQEIWEKVLAAFAQYSDIEFAYPTQRFYYK